MLVLEDVCGEVQGGGWTEELKVRVLLFATFREVAGTSSLDVELPSGATVIDVLERLTEIFGEGFKRLLFKEGGKLGDYVRIAVNKSYLRIPEELRRTVCDGDEIAIFPPASGG